MFVVRTVLPVERLAAAVSAAIARSIPTWRCTTCRRWTRVSQTRSARSARRWC